MTVYKLTSGRKFNTPRITLPLSKSISNRLMLINALTEGAIESTYAECDDTNAMATALKSNSDNINIGAAGTAMRFLTAYFATREGRTVILDGSERMRQRPISPLVTALRTIGAEIEYTANEGFPPLKITGRKLRGGNVEIDASISSQFISALMMIAPAMQEPLKIRLSGELVSRPYVDMTAELMKKFGVNTTITDDSIYIPNAPYRRTEIIVEGDWSAASYWYEIVSLTGKYVEITNLSEDSIQGDSDINELFDIVGVVSFNDGNGLFTIMKSAVNTCHSLEIDMDDMPDAAQTLAVTLCLNDVRFRMTGLGTLPRKETNRLAALQQELKKIGFVIEIENNDTIEWNGDTIEPTFEPIETYKDHRMAMAFAPAVLKFKELKMVDIDVVSKSYPTFWKDLEKIGIKAEKI